MKLRFEVHTHTKYSHDSLLNKWFYFIMLKLRKINIVAITDHNEIQGAIEYQKFLKKHNISVIVGEEIFTEKGEVIGLFLQKRIEPGLSVRDTMLEIKAQGGIVYIPHPYDEKRYKTVLPVEEIRINIELIDIIEIHNGRNKLTLFSEKQLAIANSFPKVHQLVGSDAHTFIELGRNFNLIEEFHSMEEFLCNLKYVTHIRKDCIQISHHITKFVRVFKLLRERKFHEVYRIVHRRIRRTKQRVG